MLDPALARAYRPWDTHGWPSGARDARLDGFFTWHGTDKMLESIVAGWKFRLEGGS